MQTDLSNARAKYIRELVREAAKTDKNCEIFGSKQHKYRLNPVASLEKIREFEQRYHIKLPEEYVFFLTKVGNGGAGPYYGLYSLEQLDRYNEYLDNSGADDSLTQYTFINKNMTIEEWNTKIEELEDDDKYDFVMNQICNGVLVIGTQGCTYDNLLMCSGSETGKIVYIDWNLDAGYPPFFTGISFLDWYETYFREIIANHKVTSYGYTA